MTLLLPFPPPSSYNRAEYGDITYDRKFDHKAHNNEYGTALNADVECPISYNSLNGRSVLYHRDQMGVKHPIDAECFAEWVNRKSVCPGCNQTINVGRFFKPFPRHTELPLKFIELTSRIALMSAGITTSMLLAARNNSLSSYILLGVPSILAIGGYLTAKSIRERIMLPTKFLFGSSSITTTIAAILLTAAIPVIAVETGFAAPAIKTVELISTGFGIAANAMKSFFGW